MDMPNEGKSVIGQNPIISEKYSYMIELDGRAYLIEPDQSDSDPIKVRELTQFECMCIGIKHIA